ncbi:hypothetical protein I302_105387 [Kwoniella bestiolae CBS 10118]|uniref:Uncharacterized protein n=1 Tax=Kwoniella bestiolae CBS 10118 TaxID=1296100 RepID=A0A1B9FT10_9TREE|nr:hypothetical protein I302_08669 [Kwoniella bestiolae CBS 10118]OCF21890.1 hypothetical protein I302_08669 [Kwoniella bestiolae CBS 10118]
MDSLSPHPQAARISRPELSTQVVPKSQLPLGKRSQAGTKSTAETKVFKEISTTTPSQLPSQSTHPVLHPFPPTSTQTEPKSAASKRTKSTKKAPAHTLPYGHAPIFPPLPKPSPSATYESYPPAPHPPIPPWGHPYPTGAGYHPPPAPYHHSIGEYPMYPTGTYLNHPPPIPISSRPVPTTYTKQSPIPSDTSSDANPTSSSPADQNEEIKALSKDNTLLRQSLQFLQTKFLERNGQFTKERQAHATTIERMNKTQNQVQRGYQLVKFDCDTLRSENHTLKSRTNRIDELEKSHKGLKKRVNESDKTIIRSTRDNLAYVRNTDKLKKEVNESRDALALSERVGQLQREILGGYVEVMKRAKGQIERCNGKIKELESKNDELASLVLKAGADEVQQQTEVEEK